MTGCLDTTAHQRRVNVAVLSNTEYVAAPILRMLTTPKREGV
jgi:hypothetical protein